MIRVYFSPEIYKSASKLIKYAKNNLSKSDFPPRNFCKTEMGIITLLHERENYPMHDDSVGKINKVTFLNNKFNLFTNPFEVILGIVVYLTSFIKSKHSGNKEFIWLFFARC